MRLSLRQCSEPSAVHASNSPPPKVRHKYPPHSLRQKVIWRSRGSSSITHPPQFVSSNRHRRTHRRLPLLPTYSNRPLPLQISWDRRASDIERSTGHISAHPGENLDRVDRCAAYPASLTPNFLIAFLLVIALNPSVNSTRQEFIFPRAKTRHILPLRPIRFQRYS
jgi:hypothetical protein